MPASHRILFIASEFASLAKTGGLADAVASLAARLRRHGHDARAVLPFYRSVREQAIETRVSLDSMCVVMGQGEEWCAVHETECGGVPAMLLENHRFFDRPGLYHDSQMRDYSDNPRRFGFLCRAALQWCMDGGFAPDIVHCHDWQAALAPMYLKAWFWNHPVLGKAASVLTIHNIAYQGAYPAAHAAYLGIGPDSFTEDKFESYGGINLLKGGIYYADAVNTVSRGHAREITAPYGGFGLAPYLSNKREAFSGILNGVDYSVWSPESDSLLPARYSARDLSGKAACKRALQERFGLEPRGDIALFGAIGRLTGQKGFQLLRDCIEQAMQTMQMQFVMLGSGDSDLAAFFSALPSRYPGRAAAWIGYSDELAHWIEAGADFFVMPSLFEPCGLNQLYSLRYGTPPIVRATGGLNDTVEQYNEATGGGTGFKFMAPTPEALRDTIGWAVSTYYDRPAHLQAMIRRGMAKDFSWDRSIQEYEALYETALLRKAEYDRRHPV